MRAYVIGAFVAVAVIVGWRAVGRAAIRFLRRRRRIPVGHLLRVLDHVLSTGKRISYRRLVTWRGPGGRSWGLILLKQGPKEPMPEGYRPPAPFTEPLDDPTPKEKHHAS